MNNLSPVFEETLNGYLRQVADRDWSVLSDPLGIDLLETRMAVPLFHRLFFISAMAVKDAGGNQPRHSICVLLCRYVLQCPGTVPDPGPLVTYKDFKDAVPFVGGFQDMVERPIAQTFSGRIDALEQCCRRLRGRPFDTDVGCQLAFAFLALPKVPVYLMFNDADDEFPAECTLLFRRSAEKYLDMECIAIIGDLLASWLQKTDQGEPI